MNDIEMEKQLEMLKSQHREIDDNIRDIESSPFQDQLRLMRLKKQKLQLKDQIYRLQEYIYPDIIA